MVIIRTNLGVLLGYLAAMAGVGSPDVFYVLALASVLFALFALLALGEAIYKRAKRWAGLDHRGPQVDYKTARKWEAVQAARMAEITRARGQKPGKLGS